MTRRPLLSFVCYSLLLLLAGAWLHFHAMAWLEFQARVEAEENFRAAVR